MLTSHGKQTVGFFCSLFLLFGTISYYIVFEYKLYYIALIAILILVILNRKGRFSNLKSVIPLVIFGIYQSASSLWSPIVSEGINQSALDSVFFLFSILPFAYPVLEREHLSLSLVKWYGIAMLFCLFYSEVTIGSLIDIDKGAFRSIFAASLLVALPSLTGDACLKKSKISLFILITTVVIGFLIESRVFTLFSLPIVLVSLLTCYAKDRKILFGVLPALASIAAILFIILYFTGSLNSIVKYDRLGENHTSFSLGDTVFREANSHNGNYVDIERRLVTQVSIDSFMHSPVVGAGYMSTSYYVGEFTSYNTSSHGLLTGLLAETGIVGTSLFLCICILATRGYLARARSCFPEEKRWIYLELLTFVAALTAGLFHQANHDFYLYLMIGGGLAGLRLNATEGLPVSHPSRR